MSIPLISSPSNFREKLLIDTQLGALSAIDVHDFDDSFEKYLVEITGAIDTSASFGVPYLLTSQDNVNFDNASSDYNYLYEGIRSPSSAQSSGAADSVGYLYGGYTSLVNTKLEIIQPYRSDINTVIRHETEVIDASGNVGVITGGVRRNENDIVQAIRFAFDAGTIEAGVDLKVWGIG